MHVQLPWIMFEAQCSPQEHFGGGGGHCRFYSGYTPIGQCLCSNLKYHVTYVFSCFPSRSQSVKILGEKLADLDLTRSTVSEALRIFLDSRGFDIEVCNMLRTKTFLALPPDAKAAILGFLVEELNGSNIVTRLEQNIRDSFLLLHHNVCIFLTVTATMLVYHSVPFVYSSDIDNTLENMATYRKNKWIIEGKLRK